MSITQSSPHALAQDDRAWWRGASIYQIYPRSFADSNGDGIGDLPGITAHLDYVASLGVDAIWLSPFFTSPMADFGYDVSDYRDVDPIFGTLADFDALIARAHALGLRVIIDQVYSHTSDHHPWFTESRSSWNNAKADWYVWADPKPDGSPPSNWQSVFGGPAWTWDARRRQYYLHNFLSAQPQLNCHVPAVREALLSVARFWLDRGVDGFRLDAINFSMHDPSLKDNPSKTDNALRTRPFDYQQHLYNQSHPDIVGFLQDIRALLDSYGGRFTVAEVGGDDSDREMKLFTGGDGRLSSAYSFDFLYAQELTPTLVSNSLACWPDQDGLGWPSWAFENHDAPRAVSRWSAPGHEPAFAAIKMLLLVCLRGNIFLYQGEELGLPQVEVAFADLQDPEAIANWPMTLSRDGARTPMPWRAGAPALGFSDGKPWLPVGPDHAALAIDRQEADPASPLGLTRRLLALRNDQDALRLGDLSVLHADDRVLAFERCHEGLTLLCCFNLSSEPASWSAPYARHMIDQVGSVEGDQLGAYAGYIAEKGA
ncbi:MAG TPA: alpha-glucosidase family protein [Sphingomonas sp.]|uniref:alpha-glucosidase family protein n=1 Tax=Sphingomonas sp. TaxID=28214 RepID=UPI002C14FA96|nr:alpha-glucosidase family protein [Sphingomonas sp.]HMI20453.1 alpha-glucosidase family protein [Sphingomonas sp.]